MGTDHTDHPPEACTIGGQRQRQNRKDPLSSCLKRPPYAVRQYAHKLTAATNYLPRELPATAIMGVHAVVIRTICDVQTKGKTCFLSPSWGSDYQYFFFPSHLLSSPFQWSTVVVYFLWRGGGVVEVEVEVGVVYGGHSCCPCEIAAPFRSRAWKVLFARPGMFLL